MCLNGNISCSLPLMLFNFEYNELILDLFKLLISNSLEDPDTATLGIERDKVVMSGVSSS